MYRIFCTYNQLNISVGHLNSVEVNDEDDIKLEGWNRDPIKGKTN